MTQLVIVIAPYTAGLLRRFRVFVDGEEVARLRQGKSVTVPINPGQHVVRAELDAHSGEFELALGEGSITEVSIEYAWLITDPWRSSDAFNFQVRESAARAENDNDPA